MGSTAAESDAELESFVAAVPLQLHASNRTTGSPQPSPLSQSTSAEGTTGIVSTASGLDIELFQSATTDEQDGQASSGHSTFVDSPLPEGGVHGAGSTAIATQDEECDLIPNEAGSGPDGNNSPDARLEKEYHREKVRKDGIENDDDYKASSSDEDSNTRGRQRGREKKQYRKDSNPSASDTDGGSAKKISTSSSKKPPSRKLKTFEPLREKEESMSSGHHHQF